MLVLKPDLGFSHVYAVENCDVSEQKYCVVEPMHWIKIKVYFCRDTTLMLKVKYSKQISTECNHFSNLCCCICIVNATILKFLVYEFSSKNRRISFGLKLEFYSVKFLYIGLKNLIKFRLLLLSAESLSFSTVCDDAFQ